jgi:hypothetical protein
MYAKTTLRVMGITLCPRYHYAELKKRAGRDYSHRKEEGAMTRMSRQYEPAEEVICGAHSRSAGVDALQFNEERRLP